MRIHVAGAPFLALVGAGLAGCSTPQAVPVAAAAPPPLAAEAAPVDPAANRAALYALFESSDKALLRRNPVAAFFRGDFSRADTIGNPFAADYFARERAAAEADLAALHAIDRSALGANDRLAYDIFEYSQQRMIVQTSPGILAYEALLPIDHFRGIHIFYPQLSSAGAVMPFKTVADYDNALKRHAEFGTVIDSAIARMREGMAQGVVQPRLTVETMIKQLDTQLQMTTEAMPYYSPVTEFPEAIGAADRTRLQAAFRQAIESDLRPPLQRLRTFLANEYLPASRTAIGLNAAAGGDSYYRYRIAEMTTLPLTAEEVHQTGLAEVARINAALARARAEAGGRKPKVYKDKESLTKAWYETAKRVDPKLDQLFASRPRTPLQIKPYEEYREAFNLAASYNPGDVETGKPGTFYFSGYNLANREVSPSIALYMHEGNPGHHFETMTAFENESLPDFLRYGGFTAYSEGWGLYAESLGHELGLYDDPVDRIGALAGGELLRAVRLVVDTGIHAKGWSREQAIQYMVDNGQERDFASSEVARYTVMPGQALAYKVGELKIKQLRAKAEAELGERFDVREFHAQVLGTGNLPLTILERKIDSWIATRRAQ